MENKLENKELLCYVDNGLYKCKLLNFNCDNIIENCIEFEDVKVYFNSISEFEMKSFENLEEIRDFYLKNRHQIEIKIYENNTWFSGIFNDDTIEWRSENAIDEIDYSDPIANFYGWKISEKSTFKRSGNVAIFKNSLKIDKGIIESLKNENLIETKNTWGTSIGNPLIHLITSDFNKKTKGLSIASYFHIWFWDKENKIFQSFDPEVPSMGDVFNPKDCLVYNDEIVFEFYKPFYLDRKFDAYECTVNEEEYVNVTSLGNGELYDSAFYTITELNNLIDYLKNGKFNPQIYIFNS